MNVAQRQGVGILALLPLVTASERLHMSTIRYACACERILQHLQYVYARRDSPRKCSSTCQLISGRSSGHVPIPAMAPSLRCESELPTVSEMKRMISEEVERVCRTKNRVHTMLKAGDKMLA